MLILASQSPRRRELLELAGLTFTCLPARGEEIVPEGMPAEKEPEYLAGKKAEEIFAAQSAALQQADCAALLFDPAHATIQKFRIASPIAQQDTCEPASLAEVSAGHSPAERPPHR